MSEWYESYFAAWAGTDPSKVTEWVTDDVVFEDVTLGHVYRGKAEMLKFVQWSMDKMPNMSFDVVNAHQSDEHFQIEWVMQPMGLRGVSVGTVRDSKISTDRDYWNGAFFK